MTSTSSSSPVRRTRAASSARSESSEARRARRSGGDLPRRARPARLDRQKAAGRTKDRLDLELLTEAGLIDAARLSEDERSSARITQHRASAERQAAFVWGIGDKIPAIPATRRSWPTDADGNHMRRIASDDDAPPEATRRVYEGIPWQWRIYECGTLGGYPSSSERGGTS